MHLTYIDLQISFSHEQNDFREKKRNWEGQRNSSCYHVSLFLARAARESMVTYICTYQA